MNLEDMREDALRQARVALAMERDGTLPTSFTWEEFKYQVIDPVFGNDDVHTEYNDDFLGIRASAKKPPEPYTIDMMIEKLQKMRKESPLVGGTVVCVCLPEVEYMEVREMKLDIDRDGDGDPVGAVVLIIP